MHQGVSNLTYGSQALVKELVQFEQVVGVILQALHLLFLGKLRLTLQQLIFFECIRKCLLGGQSHCDLQH